MSNFETVLCCILIPVTLVLTYIAGKEDILAQLIEMLEEKANELRSRQETKHSYLRDNKELLDKAYNQGYLSGFDFSVLMQNFLISEDGYVIDTGNYENVNAEVALRLAKKIKDHPELWKIFMVA